MVGQLRQGLNCAFGRRRLLRRTLARHDTDDGRGRHLRFLNSSVLDCIVTGTLCRHFPHISRNSVDQVHTALIHNGALTRLTHRFRLNRYLHLKPNRLGDNKFHHRSVLTSAIRTLVNNMFLSDSVRAIRGLVLG